MISRFRIDHRYFNGKHVIEAGFSILWDRKQALNNPEAITDFIDF